MKKLLVTLLLVLLIVACQKTNTSAEKLSAEKFCYAKECSKRLQEIVGICYFDESFAQQFNVKTADLVKCNIVQDCYGYLANSLTEEIIQSAKNNNYVECRLEKPKSDVFCFEQKIKIYSNVFAEEGTEIKCSDVDDCYQPLINIGAEEEELNHAKRENFLMCK